MTPAQTVFGGWWSGGNGQVQQEGTVNTFLKPHWYRVAKSVGG